MYERRFELSASGDVDGSPPGRSDAEIRQSFGTLASALDACAALVSLGETVGVTLALRADGSVSETQLATGPAPVLGCLQVAFHAAHFQPADAPTQKIWITMRVPGEHPIILGSLDKQVIRQIVHEHANQIRYCYEHELTTTAGIAGKIAMKWVISGEGAVTQVRVESTTMGNAHVEGCLSEKIKTWIFPKPKGGGIVIVSYPFVFKQTG